MPNCWKDALLLRKLLVAKRSVVEEQSDTTLEEVLRIIDREDSTTLDNTICICDYLTREGFRDSLIELKNFILKKKKNGKTRCC